MPHLVDKPEVASKAKKKIEKITMVLSPLTGSHKVDLVCKISTIEIIQEWKSRYEIDVSEEFGNINRVKKELLSIYSADKPAYTTPEIAALSSFVIHMYGGIEKILKQILILPKYDNYLII